MSLKIFKESHTNVKISAINGFMSAISTALFLDTIMTIFIFNNIATINGPEHKNEMLGAIETSYGLSELLFAIPIGYVADKYSRTLVLRSGAIMEYITLFATFFIVYQVSNKKWSDHVSYAGLVVINVLFGISLGLSSGSSNALIADSVPEGSRSTIYTITSTFQLVGSIIGPILIIILSKVFSSEDTDEWSEKKLSYIIYTGIIIHIIPVSLMFFYKDIKESTNTDLEQPLLDADADTDTVSASNKPFLTFVPCILFLAQFVIVMGSGMTVKFWPLFLTNDCKMSMQTIQILFIIIIIEIIIFQYIAQRISKIFGRIYTVFTLNILGITAQTILGLLSDYSNTWLIGFLYTFRFSIMNSSGPLMSSALMDIVPKEHRARWESLQSIITLGWCGSALLGGFINDKADYSSTFLITSACHLLGNFIYLFIRNAIPDEK